QQLRQNDQGTASNMITTSACLTTLEDVDGDAYSKTYVNHLVRENTYWQRKYAIEMERRAELERELSRQ
ncbi:unnamed protein product, partial [Amoebophrya sp. A25]